MTTLLGLETSGTLCSIAIWRDQERFEDTRNVQRMHNQVLLEMLDGLARRAGILPRDFNAVAFGAGPGSFTGVRIAAAVAQAVALAADSLVVPVSSSRAMLLASGVSHYDKVVTVCRSRANAHYLAGYRHEGGRWLLQHADALHGSWPEGYLAQQWVAVGDRPQWPTRSGSPRWLGAAPVTARHVAEIGWDALVAGDARHPRDALPHYVTGDNPWRTS